VGHDVDRKTFALRAKVLTLGFAHLSSTPLASLAQPVLDAVSGTLRESSSLAVLEGDEVVYMRAPAPRAASCRWTSDRQPPSCVLHVAGSRAARGLPPTELNAHLARAAIVRHTPHTVVGRERLRQAVDSRAPPGLRHRRPGAGDRPALDRRAGARFDGRVVAAINAGTQASRITVAELEKRFLPTLLDAASELCIPPRQ
jgi:IclR family pca regulon transcriptional regulator